MNCCVTRFRIHVVIVNCIAICRNLNKILFKLSIHLSVWFINVCGQEQMYNALSVCAI